MRKSGKRKRRQLEDGSIVEEEGEGDESSVDSLMAESPAKYGKQPADPLGRVPGSASNRGGAMSNKGSISKLYGSTMGGPKDSEKTLSQVNEKDLIDKLTQMKVPKKKPPQVPT